MSGGTEGGMAPHWVVFERGEGAGGEGPALAIGRAHTPALAGRASRPPCAGRYGRGRRPCGDGRRRHRRPGRHHFAQVKCPLLTAQRVGEAEARGAAVATRDTLKSMGLSRAASALGVAVALGEVARAALDRRADIGADWIVVVGPRERSAGSSCSAMRSWCSGCRRLDGPLAIDHAVMADAIDIEPVRAALDRLGLAAGGQLAAGSAAALVALLAKAEASHDGRLRGLSPHHARRLRHLIHPPRPRLRQRRAGRPGRPRRDLRLRRRRAPGAGRRRTGCAHRRSNPVIAGLTCSGLPHATARRKSQQHTRSPLLFTPLALRGVYGAQPHRGVADVAVSRPPTASPADWHLVHLGKFAMGGAGIVFVEETSVEVARPQDLYLLPRHLSTERAGARLAPHHRLSALAKVALSASFQLGHAGRKVATKPPWEGFVAATTEDDAKDRPHRPGVGYCAVA